MPEPYHSALSKGRIEDSRPCWNWRSPLGSLAMVHDLASPPLPLAFLACDVIYAELPWPAGMRAFNERAERDATFVGVMKGVRWALIELDIPVLLLGSKSHRRLLPEPDETVSARLRGDYATLFVYGTGLPDHVGAWSIPELMAVLARRYECVGDFTCGYGSTGRAFARAGKRYVMSDYNPLCVGFIAEHGSSWEA